MTTVHSVLTPTKGELDDRDYSFFTLPNKLDVLLISDPTADKASASLGVNVGSNSDPEEALGLFHALEHLLFMGTEKYPNESEYASYISANGGMNNAYTSAETTVYYFDINSANLEPALDRFAQFFICPLFDESSTDRELNAVNSEHNKNIPNDLWLSYELFRQSMNPNHPASRFHTGNLETLRDTPLKHGTNVRQLMLDGHKKYYSANMMKLVILGKESLTELQAYAVKHFSAIPNKDAEAPVFSTELLTEKAVILERCPIKPQRRVALSWTLPAVASKQYTYSSPLSVISHCLGDEGPGSLLSLLKAARFATALSSGTERNLSCAATFRIDIDLTPDGLLRIPDVMRLTYAYIEMMKNSTDAELLRMCEEAQLLDTINFRTKEKSAPADYTSELVEVMYKYEPKDIVTNSNLYHTISLPDIRFFVDKLTIENSATAVISPDVCRDVKIIGDEIYDVKQAKNCVEYADFQSKYTSNQRISTQELTLKEESTETDADIIESKAIAEINAEFNKKQWGFDHFYRMKFSKYTLDEAFQRYITSGLVSNDLQIAATNEPATYGKFISKEGKIDESLCSDDNILHSILSLPCPNPYIPHSFDTIPRKLAKDLEFKEIKCCCSCSNATKGSAEDDKKGIYSTFTSNSMESVVFDLPLQLLEDEKDAKYKNSLPNLCYNDKYSTLSPTKLVNHCMELDDLKTFIADQVQQHLVGFDRTHSVNDLITAHYNKKHGLDGDNEQYVAKDVVTDEVVDAIFGTNIENDSSTPAASSKPTRPSDSNPSSPTAQEADKDAENDKEGDEDDEAEDEDDEEDSKEQNGPALLHTVDTFFDKITKSDPVLGYQLLPPQLIPIPLPYTKTHFPFSINAQQNNTKTVPMQPPVECWYKRLDHYNTPNVDLTATIMFPRFQSEVFLQLYSYALKDFLSEVLYPAQLVNISYSIQFGQNLTVTVRGHREGAAQCFLSIIDNLFNPLIDAPALLRQVDKLQRNLAANFTSGALQQAVRHNAGVVYPNGSHFTELLNELPDICDVATLTSLISALKSHQSTMTFCAVGNMSKPYVIRLAQTAAVTLRFKEIKSSQIPLASSQVILPRGNHIGLFENGNPNDNQNAVFNQYAFSGCYKAELSRTQLLLEMNKKENGQLLSPIAKNGPKLTDLATNPAAVWDMMSFYGHIIYSFVFSQLLSDHTFACLRTKQQLGYIAGSQHYFSSSQYGFAIYLQSERPTSYLDERIEYYLKEEVKQYFTQNVTDQPSCLLDDELFLSNMTGSQTVLLSKLDNLSNEASGYVSAINNRQYDFFRPLILAFLLPHLHRHTLLAFYNHFYRASRVNPESNNVSSLMTRRKWALHVINKKGNDDTNLTAYQQYVPQHVYNDFTEVMGFKLMNPSV